VAGLITAGTALAVYAVQPPASAWLALAGLAAAVAACLAALPSWRQDRLRSARRTPRAKNAVKPWFQCVLTP
jgi:hypothetical protein